MSQIDSAKIIQIIQDSNSVKVSIFREDNHDWHYHLKDYESRI